MAYRFTPDLKWSDVTPRADFLNRRQLITGAMALGLAGPAAAKLAYVPSAYSTDAAPNTLEDITAYNNFYEFGTDKYSPAKEAHRLRTRPWTVSIEGHVKKNAVGEFVLPGLLKITTVRKPAVKARKGINPFTKEEVMFKAKPATTVVKVRALKKLKDMVL